MLTQKEQIKNLEEYLKRKLTTDEIFIFECVHATYEIENKKTKKNKFDNLSPKDVRESMEASDMAWKED